MKSLIPILPLLFASCSTNQVTENGIEWTPLTENEKYQIISEGYGSYLDSINRDKTIYYRFAVLEDSTEIDHYVKSSEENSETIFFIPKQPSFARIMFEVEVDTSSLEQFEFTNRELVDSLYQDPKWHENDEHYYAITRPYQSDSMSYAVIQEFEIPGPKSTDCESHRYTYLIFKRVNGKWRFVEKNSL